MKTKSSNTHYLNIHHRSMGLNENKNNNQYNLSFSPGHFYVSLQKDNQKQFFGKYSQEGYIFGKEIIRSKEEERNTEEIKKLEKETGKKYHSCKSIILIEDQYNSALKYALSKISGKIKESYYILGAKDCTDFVQAVYNKAGLPLYFTVVFSLKELVSLGSFAAYSVLNKYGTKDSLKLTFNAVECRSEEDLAKKLNIDVRYISLNSPDIDLNAPLLKKATFKVITDHIKLPKVINVGSKSSPSNSQDSDNTTIDTDLDNILNLLPLSKEQKQQTSNSTKGFFENMMSNSCGFDPKDFMPSQKDLFPEPDKKTQEWINDLVTTSENIINDLSFDDKSQSQNYNPYQAFHNSVSDSSNLIGQIFDNTKINDDTSLD
jgi:hypothetical protein